MKTLLLIDAHALIHRSFHALPPLTAPDGRPVGALYGLSSTLVKLLSNDPPTHAAAAFDRPEPTFRKTIFQEYKAHRPPAADELIAQIVAAHELFETFGIPLFEKPGYEADDLIGTLAKRFASKETKVVILTGDLDTLQLVSDNRIVVRTLKKGVTETVVYNEAAVHERFGLSPEQLPDYKGLVGDPSDNIPGVHGVGPKTATALLQKFGTLERLFENAAVTDRQAAKALSHREAALFSKKLATIDCAVPIDASLTALAYSGFIPERLASYFESLGFQSLLRRIGTAPLSHTPKESRREETTSVTSIPILTIKDLEDALDHRPELASNALKIAGAWKPLVTELAAKGIEVADPLFDLGVAGWLLGPDETDFSVEALARRFAPSHARDDRHATITALFVALSRELRRFQLMNVAERIEMPLIRVLSAMERRGIAVDRNALNVLGERIGTVIKKNAERIFDMAGTSFNLNSPRQVAEILFERLHLSAPKARKTPTGQRRTGREVLESLREQHPIVPLILGYREDFKIKSSFVDPLRTQLGADGRVRTTFLQTGTGTGRLSSEKPNLQNIPQESRWAPELRRAFVAPEGFKLLSLDYSQLELRLLAHSTGDPGLLTAFREGKDIHAITAARVFHVDERAVTPPMRRIGKTLNFGIVYGMGARAFAQASGLSHTEAERVIADYFTVFPSIRQWQEATRACARRDGYVANANGRVRWFRKIRVSGGEFDRAAINMPLQSLGADIVKLAMIESYRTLTERGALGRTAHLVLSIHDELLFEIQGAMVSEIASVLRHTMETVYPLAVPLRVDVSIGACWGDLHPLL
ncbi:MAG: DNA polymerase [Patescibacteria group bacterium]